MTDSEKLDAIFQMLGALAEKITGKTPLIIFPVDNTDKVRMFCATPAKFIIWAVRDGALLSTQQELEPHCHEPSQEPHESV